jgi:hypothetical protein
MGEVLGKGRERKRQPNYSMNVFVCQGSLLIGFCRFLNSMGGCQLTLRQGRDDVVGLLPYDWRQSAGAES